MTTPQTDPTKGIKADDARPGKAAAPGAKPATRKTHGLDPAQRQAILDAQGSRCAICGTRQTGKPGGRLAVDHDHAHCPGRSGCVECVRGLLCVRCNNLLRSARDDKAILRKAISYLAGPRTPLGPKPAVDRPSTVPSASHLAMLFPNDDYRLLPMAGRRDRLFMNLLQDPLSPQTVAEVSWMENHDRTGLAMAMARMDRKGRNGSFEAWFRAAIDRILAGPDRATFAAAVRAEERRLASNQREPVIKIDPTSTRGTMDGRITVDGVNLEDINAFLRRKASQDALDQPTE